MADLKLTGIRKAFGIVEVLKSIDLDIADGEFVVFVGPSGCGKSTLLRVIAGLEGVDRGEIAIDGRRVNEREPAERQIAMVFQSYALYPHMTVFENMAFGLTFLKLPKAEIRRRVERAAASLRLEAVLDRKPAALSGGQRQRVAIGRAIVREPKIFLFDEPLSNLDAALRVATRIELAKLHRELKSTMIYVTHDQVEAMTLADKIVVLNEGRIEQVGSPLDLYHAPASRFVAGFIGSPAMNFVSARCAGRDGRDMVVEVAGEPLVLPAPASSIDRGDRLEIGMRPEHFVADPAGALRVSGTVEFVEHLGETSVVYLRLSDGQQVVVRRPGDVFAEPGSPYAAHVPVACLHAFDEKGGVLLGRRSGPSAGADDARSLDRARHG